MIAILFALISYFGWGIGDIFGTVATRKIGGFATAFYVFAFGFILNTTYAPFVLSELGKFTIQSLILTIFLALLAAISLMLFYEGLRRGNAVIVGTIASCYSAVAILLSLVFLGETISFNQTAAIVIILLGIILSGLDFSKLKGRDFLIDKGIPYAFTAMILWGIYFTFLKIPVRQIGWFWPNYISLMSFPLIFLIIRARKIKLVKPSKKVVISLIFSALLLNAGAFGYNSAIKIGSVALVAPIASSAITLFAVLAFLIFRDRITKQQIAGIITTLIGIVFLSVFSV